MIEIQKTNCRRREIIFALQRLQHWCCDADERKEDPGGLMRRCNSGVASRESKNHP
jgi:hypothetical protein